MRIKRGAANAAPRFLWWHHFIDQYEVREPALVTTIQQP